jgi:RND family efflux transporter MFP subunit
MRKRLWVIAILLFIALLIAYRVNALREKAAAQRAEVSRTDAVPVRIAPVERGDLEEVARLTGNIEPIQSVEVIAKVRGRVSRVLKHIGDPVRAGETLAVIDPVDYALQVKRLEGVLAQAGANQEQVQRDADRAEQLSRDRVISTQAVQAALSNAKASAGRLKEAEAALALARERLSDTNVTSPIDGIVSERFVDVGTMVDTQMMGNRRAVALYEVKNLETVKLTVGISENDLPRSKVGQGATIKLRAIPSRTFEGKLVHVAPSLQEGTRRAKGEIQIDNPEHLLKPGMFATAELLLERHTQVTLIPKDAVVKRGGRNVVFLAGEDVARMTPVTLEGSDDRFIIVASGVKPGDKLVVKGQTIVEDGSPIRAEANGDGGNQEPSVQAATAGAN